MFRFKNKLLIRVAFLLILVATIFFLTSMILRYNGAKKELDSFTSIDWNSVREGAISNSSFEKLITAQYSTLEALSDLQTVLETAKYSQPFDWRGPDDGGCTYTITLLMHDGSSKSLNLAAYYNGDNPPGLYFCLLRDGKGGSYPTILVDMQGLEELVENARFQISQEEYNALPWVTPVA